MYAATFMHEFQVLAARGLRRAVHQPARQQGLRRSVHRAHLRRLGQPGRRRLHGRRRRAAALALGRSGRDSGVTGGSYGGFMTAWLVGHTDRFQAAVVTARLLQLRVVLRHLGHRPVVRRLHPGRAGVRARGAVPRAVAADLRAADAHAAAADPQRTATCAVRSSRPSSSSSSCGAWARSKSRWSAFPKKATT